MRIVLFGAFALSACGSGDSADPVAAPEDEGAIDCRVRGDDSFERSCTLEAHESEVGRTLVLRYPDGGFRRLLVADDGAIVAADGAERALTTEREDGRIQVSLGGDDFLLPASVRTP
jgi:hypothetical protein